MKNVKKIISVMLCVVLSLSLFAGCGKKDTDKGKDNSDGFKSLYGDLSAEDRLLFEKRNVEGDADLKVFWHQTSARDDIKDAAEMYKQLYGGNIEFYFSAWNDRATDLALLNSSNQLPDVLFGFLEYDFPKFIDMGLFGEITDSDFDFDSKYIDKASVESLLVKDSKKYGIAVKDDPEVIIYNKEYIENMGYDTPYEMYKAGKWDWNSFKTLAKNLSYDSDNDGMIDHYGFHCWSPKALFVSNNTWPLVNKGGNATLNIDSAPVTQTYQLLYDMINVDKSSPNQVNVDNETFIKGNIAMRLERPYTINILVKSGMNAENLEIAPVPKGENASEYLSYYSPAVSTIGNSCKNKEAALALIECYISVQNAMSKTGPRESYGYTFTEQQQEVMDIVRNNKTVEIVSTGRGSFNNLLTDTYKQLCEGSTVSAAVELNKNKMLSEINAQ